MKAVAIIYHYLPHYRAAVFRELLGSKRYRFFVCGSRLSLDGVPMIEGAANIPKVVLKTRKWRRWFRISGYWRPVLDKRTEAVILIANPNILDTWLIGVACRLLKKPLIFWGHGWLRPERAIKRHLRRTYHALASEVMVYGGHSVELARSQGFRGRVTAIYNSLDWQQAQRYRAEIALEDRAEWCSQNGLDSKVPLISCVARLTTACGLHLLLQAAQAIRRQGHAIEIAIVGDGPEMRTLRSLDGTLRTGAHFFGAVYDEAWLARLFYFSDLTVSPGKVGLTAIHSMYYGTPVISHGEMAHQMPEVEAVIDGKTGALFREGDAVDLARVILDWLGTKSDRNMVRANCLSSVESAWTPDAQREAIERVVERAIGP